MKKSGAQRLLFKVLKVADAMLRTKLVAYAHRANVILLYLSWVCAPGLLTSQVLGIREMRGDVLSG